MSAPDYEDVPPQCPSPPPTDDVWEIIESKDLQLVNIITNTVRDLLQTENNKCISNVNINLEYKTIQITLRKNTPKNGLVYVKQFFKHVMDYPIQIIGVVFTTKFLFG
jgi:hypothetical protein